MNFYFQGDNNLLVFSFYTNHLKNVNKKKWPKGLLFFYYLPQGFFMHRKLQVISQFSNFKTIGILCHKFIEETLQLSVYWVH